MLKFRYGYKTRITFSENVYSHHFLIRCTPWTNEAQHILENSCNVLPTTAMAVGSDAFNNTIFTGYINEFHNFFEFESNGVVLLSNYCLAEPLNRIFHYPSKYTQPTSLILSVFEQLKFPENSQMSDKIFIISEKIQQLLTYQSGITTIQTTAHQAIEIGKGVCQDFSHIMISLCRKCGIAARYVTGFMQGEGFTHAWIEYYDNGKWYGFDPTHHCAIVTGYIKIAHGRDYADCAMDKGVFSGVAQQQLDVFLNVAIEQ